MAIGVGLALGVALGALLEYRDTTLRTESQINEAFRIPVLAVLPFMESADEKRRRVGRIALTAAAGFVLVASVALGAAWRLGLWKRLL